MKSRPQQNERTAQKWTARARRGAAIVLAFLSSRCFPLPVEVPTRPQVFDAHELEGEWFVVATNFPMWLDGKKLDPRFNYSAFRQVDGQIAMNDEVSYVKAGSSARETINGVDVQDPSVPAHFTWRGNGILSLFTSEWYVAHHDAELGFAIIYFTETLATPAGLDVITRSANPSSEVVHAAKERIETDAFLRESGRGLVWLTR